MRRLGIDYNRNPKQFVEDLRTSTLQTPNVFADFVKIASGYLKTVARPAWVEEQTAGIRVALNNLGQEALSQKNEDLQTAVAMVKEAFGFQAGQTTQALADPRLLELEQKNAEFEQRQRNADQANRLAFLQTVVKDSRQAVYNEIGRRWAEIAPAGLTPQETKRAVDDIFVGVESELQGVKNFVTDLESRRNGPLTQQAYNEAVKYAFDRATPFIPLYQKQALDFWSPRANATTQLRNETEKRAAGQVNAANVVGSTPKPVEVNTKEKFIKDLGADKSLSFRDKLMAGMRGSR
jgi:hypothetical protein